MLLLACVTHHLPLPIPQNPALPGGLIPPMPPLPPKAGGGGG
jgi:hypothetical protein